MGTGYPTAVASCAPVKLTVVAQAPVSALTAMLAGQVNVGACSTVRLLVAELVW